MPISKLTSLLAVGVLSGGLFACGADESQPSSNVRTGPSPTATATAPPAAEGELDRPMTVPAEANIFGAGHEQPPAPGGGGPGVLPPVLRLPQAAHRVVSFAKVTGRVNPIVGMADENGSAGDGVGPTDVTSYGGISGIVHRRNGMFLVGVFLTDDPPAGAAPPRLSFTRRERFDPLSPRIAQTFLVGNGKGRSYRVPARATRLFLGFADGYLYVGHPGWYGNNDGELAVTVGMATG